MFDSAPCLVVCECDCFVAQFVVCYVFHYFWRIVLHLVACVDCLVIHCIFVELICVLSLCSVRCCSMCIWGNI